MTDKKELTGIVFEHNGALGDMLLAWPAFFSVSARYPHVPRLFRTRPAHAPFPAALDAAPCPPGLSRELDGLYAAASWPPALDRVLVVRPGLCTRPEVPRDPRFLFLPGVSPGRFDPPHVLYREALAERGIPWRGDWISAFRARFGASAPEGRTVLLVPGAGHVKKTWPMERFRELAGRLARDGFDPVFLLGPAEVERGLDCGPWPCRVPGDLAALMTLLKTARAVVGADCGPMHLAGLLGTPGAALFGPTSACQWGPAGMRIVSADPSCSPCVQVTSGDFAPACPTPPPCLAGIAVDRVLAELRGILEA
ncbi:MAG: glycosyltransferase family 9 protein [Thermodesulfobacteriota bacterium]